ncbi:MAG: hypothetical protein HY686_07310 [Chloroflexi bacterium]|nr:hypothetical protein [Chloroflexota bacterium]
MSGQGKQRYDEFLQHNRDAIEGYYGQNKMNIITASKSYNYPGGRGKRDELERRIQQSLADNGDAVSREVFVEVEKWGFGTDKISQLDPGCVMQATKAAFTCLHEGMLKEAAVKLTNLKDVGIARASKLLALSNQRDFGIYDSRAANALKSLDPSGKLVIPIPPSRRKPGKGSNYYLGFENFTWVLRYMADKFRTDFPECKDWRVADVEIGLFMLGKECR